ncbi:hypothetical protein MJO29_014428 [Puccinia striiformis f. sp. tritici]|nr:hypothetical protein MJO29_014428 [Puccinia striiformis f. sp. tritici]
MKPVQGPQEEDGKETIEPFHGYLGIDELNLVSTFGKQHRLIVFERTCTSQILRRLQPRYRVETSGHHYSEKTDILVSYGGEMRQSINYTDTWIQTAVRSHNALMEDRTYLGYKQIQNTILGMFNGTDRDQEERNRLIADMSNRNSVVE